MTPREHKEFEEQQAAEQKDLSENWHYPLSKENDNFSEVLDEMQDWKILPKDVPLIIKLVENPSHFPARWIGGAVDLFIHDCMHIVLGRGVMPKDEAFVIGFTMGGDKKMSRFRKNLFMFCSKYLYPEEYRFGEEERFVFNLGIMAGSLCEVDISSTDFSSELMCRSTVKEVRKELGINLTLLRHCYNLERSCFPYSKESGRLLRHE